MILKFYKAEVKDSITVFSNAKIKAQNKGLAVAIWSFVMLVWVPAVLFCTYPLILLYFTVKNSITLCSCGAMNALDHEERTCMKGLKATIAVFKQLINQTLRESKIKYGYMISLECHTEVNLHDKYEILDYKS